MLKKIVVGFSLLHLCCATMTKKNNPLFGLPLRPLIIAHRGGSLEAPENTLTAIKHALKCGTDWQEVDVTLSFDGIPVVIHDDTLDRTTSGKGLVENQTLEALKKFTILTHDSIPTLAEVLALEDTRLMIELKKTPRTHMLIQKVIEVIQRANAHNRVGIGSFDPEVLDEVHRYEPSLPLIGIIDNLNMLDAMLALPIAVLATDTQLVDAVLNKVPAALSVWTWTVYNKEQALELADKGVHGLITDVPSAVMQTLRAEHE